jgi:uncharacterized membrane protein YidH (DUF202 family)
MSVVGAIRGGSVNFPLFLHVLGAMLLMGTLFAVALALALSWRRQWTGAGLTRLGLRMLPIGVVPAYVLMRVGAQWTESRENLPEPVVDATWLSIGYITADGGAIVILVSVVLAVLGLRKLRSGTGGSRLAGAAGLLSTLLLAAYVVTVWAMSTKPD